MDLPSKSLSSFKIKEFPNVYQRETKFLIRLFDFNSLLIFSKNLP